MDKLRFLLLFRAHLDMVSTVFGCAVNSPHIEILDRTNRTRSFLNRPILKLSFYTDTETIIILLHNS